jgi:hypothetical protein
MTSTVQIKKLIVLLIILPLLYASGCRKVEQSTLGNTITCYAATYSDGVYKSDNGGISWYPLAADQEDIGLYSKRLFPSPDNKRLYVATTGGGLFYLDMGAGSLNRISEFKDEDVRSVAFRDAGQGSYDILVGKQETGIYMAAEGLGDWKVFNNGLTYHDVNVLYKIAGTIYAGTIKGIFKLAETSNAWSDVSGDIVNKNITAIGASPKGDIIYAGAGAFQDTKGRFEDSPSLYKSADSGKTWDASDKGLPGDVLVFSIAVNPLKPERIYLGTSAGIFRSIDSGNKWSELKSDLLKVLDIEMVNMPDGKEIVYAAGAYGIYIAQDEDEPVWTTRNYGLEKTVISSIIIQGK